MSEPSSGARIGMGGLAVAAIAVFAVFAAYLTNMALQEGRESPFEFKEINSRELANWCILSGALALAAGIILLRLGAARTFAVILALCYFVLVIGLDILFTLKETDRGVLSARHVGIVEATVFVVAAAAVLGQLDAAQRGTGAIALTRATGYFVLGLFVAASTIWIFGGGWLGVPAGKRLVESAPGSLADSTPGKKVCIMIEGTEQGEKRIEYAQKVIAEQLQVPEERVVPEARFDTDLNAHEIDMQELVEVYFQKDFCLEYKRGDEDMLITVKDAYDYVLDPAHFREWHAGQSRYR